jgi:hypothetical protein
MAIPNGSNLNFFGEAPEQLANWDTIFGFIPPSSSSNTVRSINDLAAHK